MKVYMVTLNYCDCDWDHGRWQSPIFRHRRDAVAFLEAIKALPEDSDQYWKSSDASQEDCYGPGDAVILEMDVLDAFDGNIPSRDSMLHYTIG